MSTTPTIEHDLSTGLQALGLISTPHALAQLLQYLALLQKWNKTYNLTSIRDPAMMLTHHLLDALAVVNPLNRNCPDAQAVLDVGTGAGLPGVVLAIMCPHLNLLCVDAVGKKIAFVNQVSLVLGLENLKAVHSRIEDVEGRFDVITSRAFSSLDDFYGCSAHLSHEKTRWMAMKAQITQEELSQVAPLTEVFHVEHLQVPGLDAKRCIVWMGRPRDRDPMT
jgi:16S rRNA (guanine527-N7)-methyltransferase